MDFPLRIYCPMDLYQGEYRQHVFPLLKPFFKEGKFTDEDRIAIYGVSEKNYQRVNSLTESDVMILPMSWNFYQNTGDVNKVEKFILEASRFGKPVWALNIMDRPLKDLSYSNLKIFEPALYKTKRLKQEIVMPVFIPDALKEIYEKNDIIERLYNSSPTIGFCGFIKDTLGQGMTEKVSKAYHNLKSYTNSIPLQKEPLLNISKLRKNVLKQVEKSQSLKSNFITRPKHSAHISTGNEVYRKEFYDNMINSDYILCMRGAGNFSVRLYETLSMGRIPIFINTDCELPLENVLNWNERMVWVEYEELETLEKRVMEFHGQFNSQTFNDFLKENKTFWLNNLTLSGFFKHIVNEL